MVVIYAGSDIIETTDEHPFYAEGKAWLKAGNLKTGDTLRLLNGSKDQIYNVEVRKLDKGIKAYNFEVEDFHTYFVGATGILVHNTCYVKSRTKNDVLDNLINGSIMKTDDVLDLASVYLGEEYIEPVNGSGRFVSKDGRRVFRMVKMTF